MIARLRASATTRLLGGVLCLVLAAPLKAAEAMPVAADVQVALLLKILTYDRSFAYKAKSEVSIGVVYVPSDPESVRARDEVLKTLSQLAGRTIKSLPIRYAAIEYRDPVSLEKAVRANRVNVFYVAPGNSQSLAALMKLSQTYAITTVTGVPEYVSRGIAIGIGARAGNKPDILINLASSRKEGSEFDASLLRIATVVK
jgi:YfiR/HmsC-like